MCLYVRVVIWNLFGAWHSCVVLYVCIYITRTSTSNVYVTYMYTNVVTFWHSERTSVLY